MTVTNARSIYVGGPNGGQEFLHPTRTGPWPPYIAATPATGGQHVYELDSAATVATRAVYRYVGHRPVTR